MCANRIDNYLVQEIKRLQPCESYFLTFPKNMRCLSCNYNICLTTNCPNRYEVLPGHRLIIRAGIMHDVYIAYARESCMVYAQYTTLHDHNSCRAYALHTSGYAARSMHYLVLDYPCTTSKSIQKCNHEFSNGKAL